MIATIAPSMAPTAVFTLTQDYAHLTRKLDQTKPVSSYGRRPSQGLQGAKFSKALVRATMQKHIRGVNPHECEAGAEDAFFVADVGEVYRQHMRWKQHLPRVTPHYAVKCNPDPTVIRLLAALGCGFDCATKTEIEQVLNSGIDPSRIIYAHPCKTKSYLRYATTQNVTRTTFDNTDELYKIKEIAPDAELFLRIWTDDATSVFKMSQKYGAKLENVPELLELAKDLNLNLAGVAFHIGSGAKDPAAFTGAVRDARTVFNLAAQLGMSMHTLDVGGGFASDSFETMAAVLTEALADHFPPHVRVIAEPGRYYAESAFTIACNVIARRLIENKELDTKSHMLYLNDGVYGNFSNVIFEETHPIPQILSQSSQSEDHRPDSGYMSVKPIDHDDGKMIEYSIWGPTCDGIDRIAEKWACSKTISTGDWLYFEDMGAYSKCLASRFNGFQDRHDTIYVSSEPAASALLGL